MTILQINSVPYGSTAKIMIGIAQITTENGHKAMTASGYSYHPINNLPENHINIGNAVDKFLHMKLSCITGRIGLYSKRATKKLINKIETINPDIIHLHNLHGWYINLPLLFKFIKEKKIKVFWTLHDCWSFTGHCPHYDMIGCEKWKIHCEKCPQYKDYPTTYIDNSKIMYERKKEWFAGIKDLTLVTPSEWLADQVKQSFLKDYPIKVINNGIDLSVFKPTESNFREKYNLVGKKVILGVAFGWGKRKGLDAFVELSKRLSDDYRIVLVGTDDKTDKRLPNDIISIHRTQNQVELAQIYTAADLFVNPTREENFPTVNIESLACGTPILTFRTGGSPEIIDETCGTVVDKNDVDALEKEIIRITTDKPYSSEACIIRAKRYDMNDKFAEYVALYEGDKK